MKTKQMQLNAALLQSLGLSKESAKIVIDHVEELTAQKKALLEALIEWKAHATNFGNPIPDKARDAISQATS